MNLCHVEPNAELALRDEARAELVEVTEELTDANALLSAQSAQSRNGVFHILRGVADDLSLAHTRLSLGEVRKTVVEVAPDSDQLPVAVNFLAEIDASGPTPG